MQGIVGVSVSSYSSHVCEVSIALPSAVNVSCQWSLICCSLSISQISCLSSTSPVDDLSLAVPWPFCVLEFEQHAVLYLALTLTHCCLVM